MAEFQFKIDTVIVDHPKNWREIEIVYKRDDNIVGWFTTYSSVFEWIGTGYSAIKSAFDADICDTVAVDIEWRCSRFDSFTNLFSGDIVLKEMKWSEDFTCMSSAEVELNTCVADFLEYFDKEFDINEDKTKSFQGVGSPGSNLTEPLEQINATFEVPSEATYNSLGYPDQYGGRIFDVMDNNVQWMTDDCMTLESTFLSTVYAPTILRIDFTTDPTNGDTITFRVSDQSWFNHRYELEVDVNWVANLEKVLLGSQSDIKPTFYQSNAYDVVHSVPGGGITNRFDVFYFYGVDITSSNFATGVGTFTEFQAQVVGGDGLFLSNGRLLIDKERTDKGNCVFTFGDLYEALDRLFDLGIQLIFNVTWKVKIERKEDILSTPSTLTIRNVKNIGRSVNQAKFAFAVALGNEYEAIPTYSGEIVGAMPEESTNLKHATENFNCGLMDRTIQKEFWCNTGNKLNVTVSEEKEYDEDLFIIDTVVNGGNRDALKCQYRYYDHVVANAFETRSCYNVWFRPEALFPYASFTLPIREDATAINGISRTVRSVFTVAGSFAVTILADDLDSVPTNAGFSYKFVEFERHISKSDFDAIQQLQKITFNPGSTPGDDVTGFIVEIRHRVFDGRTMFKLETS